MKLRLCITFRSFDFDFIPFFENRYYECGSFSELNDFIFHHICNSDFSSKIIGFFIDVYDLS